MRAPGGAGNFPAMRTRTRVRKAEDEKVVSELTDIEVEEVSVVERAANARKFLLLKAEAKTEEKPADAEAKPAGEASKISKEARAELVALLKGALEQIELIGDQIARAVVADGAGVPEAASAALARLRKMFAGEAGGESDVDKGEKTETEKAGAKISASRLARLEEARAQAASHLELLDGVLSEVRPGEAAEQETEKGSKKEEPRPAAKAEIPEELAETLEQVGKSLKTLTDVVVRQGEELADLKKSADEPAPARGASRQVAGEGREDVEKGGDVSWPLDMNRPIDRKTTPVEKSFYRD